MSSTNEPHVLYRLFDTSDNLLYIGITNDPELRWKQHGKVKNWWRQVATIRVEHFDSRDDALAAEKAAIKAEKPRWNVTHTEKPRQRARPRVARLFNGEVWVNMSEACRLLGTHAAEVHRLSDQGILRSRRLAGGPTLRGPRQISLPSIDKLLGEAENHNEPPMDVQPTTC